MINQNKRYMKKLIGGFAMLAVLLGGCSKDNYDDSITQSQRFQKAEIKKVTLDQVPFLMPTVEKFQSRHATSRTIADLDLDLSKFSNTQRRMVTKVTASPSSGTISLTKRITFSKRCTSSRAKKNTKPLLPNTTKKTIRRNSTWPPLPVRSKSQI